MRTIGKTSLVAALGLFGAGCTTVEVTMPPVGGTDAIVFRANARIRDHAMNYYLFSPGTTLVDRGDGSYCGPALLSSMPQYLDVCVGVRGDDILVINKGAFLKEVERQVPPGTFIRTKI